MLPKITAPDDDPVNHEFQSDGDRWEDVRKKKPNEFEPMHGFIYLNEQDCPEKQEYEAFHYESHVEESGVSPGDSN